jgi:lysine-ketoglutarate reductase/saccharopine dehydrogenase-like protein (TIGR00300 family)
MENTARTLEIVGHLLDSGLMNEILDRITDNGGNFEVVRFDAGRTRDEVSTAIVRVSAPSDTALKEIIERLLALGARVPTLEETDSRLVAVTQPGVAPEDFYSTTIYRTEVRVKGEWLPVQNQRMDVVIVVESNTQTASCRLMRDLQVGDLIVGGVDGIRTFPPERANSDGNEFAFMASSVSSERRVELAVEEIAQDLTQIRADGGKVVVVPGPVVIHTGGANYLASLIREGYIHALLGGNAIAVHDIEQHLFGTSLGVNMEKGQPVHEGHKHHLRAINRIRKYGSIRAAVQAGVVTGGVMYECVQKDIPFVLAGSIRDDGPLPDTEMNLIAAQTAYSETLRGADLILMLSSMLHSIGVGNMTPAGVKLVCVDINPAVVTKLADRGSIESVGIVTDVGLFLRLLAGRLNLA